PSWSGLLHDPLLVAWSTPPVGRGPRRCSGFKDNPTYGMNLPDRRHVGPQVGGPGPAARGVTHVEEEGSLDFHRDGRTVEIVVRSRQTIRRITEERLVVGACLGQDFARLVPR